MKILTPEEVRDRVRKGCSIEDLAQETETTPAMIYLRLRELGLLQKVLSNRKNAKSLTPDS
jgi:hypothetical protein